MWCPYIAGVKQVVIITNEPGQLAVEYDGYTTILREHIKELRMGPKAAAWLIDTLYKVLPGYTDETFALTAQGRRVLNGLP